jgi:hypothetical protein
MLSEKLTAKENFRLFASGKTPQRYPLTGMLNSDFRPFSPRMFPEYVARHMVIDGEGPCEYPTNHTYCSWFDLYWDFVPVANGATVHPGNPRLTSMSDWEQHLTLPDLDELDWEGCAAHNQEYCNDSNQLIQMVVLTGFWERLISLMDVENAAVALIDEEQADGVKRFMQKNAELLIGFVDRMSDILPIDNVMIHDDWGHQNSAFFSLDTCREMILPYIRQLTDFIHKKGMTVEFHCCGKNIALVPAMVEMGVDIWNGQPINDFDTLAEQYKGTGIGFGIPGPQVEKDADEAALRAAAREFVLRHREHHIGINVWRTAPEVIPYLLEYSEKLYAGEEF